MSTAQHVLRMRDEPAFKVSNNETTTTTTAPVTASALSLLNSQQHMENKCQQQQNELQQISPEYAIHLVNKGNHLHSTFNTDVPYGTQQQQENVSKIDKVNGKQPAITTVSTSTNQKPILFPSPNYNQMSGNKTKNNNNNNNHSNNNNNNSNNLTNNNNRIDNSLCKVYTCLFILTLAVITLFVLFYSYVSTITTTTTTLTQQCCHNVKCIRAGINDANANEMYIQKYHNKNNNRNNKSNSNNNNNNYDKTITITDHNINVFIDAYVKAHAVMDAIANANANLNGDGNANTDNADPKDNADAPYNILHSPLKHFQSEFLWACKPLIRVMIEDILWEQMSNQNITTNILKHLGHQQQQQQQQRHRGHYHHHYRRRRHHHHQHHLQQQQQEQQLPKINSIDESLEYSTVEKILNTDSNTKRYHRAINPLDNYNESQRSKISEQNIPNIYKSHRTFVTTQIESTAYDDDDEQNHPVSFGNKVQNAPRRKRRDITSPSTTTARADAFIEFFTPNQRKVLEEQDLEIRKRTGLNGAAAESDDWIYLNTYCRVPEKMITGFCQSTQEYCPPSPPGAPGAIGPKGPPGLPGLPGLPGIPGPKGNRGDVGLPGPPGVDGASGPMGPRGPKGDTGSTGQPGLDGRDGVPGEPGLDGVPGRAGADGIPGKDGIPGQDGRDGQNGKDGKDGIQGPKGAQGPPGERGLKGIAGPRGRPGKPGTNGIPGVPGINAWKVQFHNGTYSTDLLIPPSITDAITAYDQRTVIVEEGKTLNLSCTAIGNPLPRVEWRRDDGHTININGIELSSINGEYIKFVNITRYQMAAYTCYANNGIAPVANATYLVEVQFPPMISVYRQMIYAEYGRSAILECLVEAFPEAIKYWERAYDGKILDPGDKYRIETYPDGFKTQMRLTITNLRKDDFGYYHCIARNELNATMVNFEVAPQDPNSETPYVGKEVKIYGKPPPETGCPICDICPDPSLLQCKDSINTNFEVQPTGNFSYPGLPKRKKSCLLYAVGKPVFHKFVDENYGSWLKDAAANELDREKTFVTNEKDNFNLYEFTSKIQYRMNDVPRKKYEISEGFQGNAHVIYNGSFYYQQYNTDLVVKMDLVTMKKTSVQLPYSGIITGNKLYSTDYNYMDFNVDEVGLWVIYSSHDSNNTLVAKLNADNLRIQYNFNITLDHRKFGEMFIVCGHLYAIDSGQEKNSQIRYAVDLYNGNLLNIDLPFTNPFRKTTTVGYNPYTVELYSWDKGNALTYPIRYHEQNFGDDHA